MAAIQGERWYVIFCKSRQEKRVCHYLGTKGFETYYPTCRVQPSNSQSPQVKPLFPRYLFVQADLDVTGTSTWNWIPGAVGLVTFGGVPASIPQHIINELKDRMADDDSTVSFSRSIRRGEPVRIVRGPFSGYEAIFDARLSGTQRVRVLLSMLDRQVKASISINAIETLSNPQ